MPKPLLFLIALLAAPAWAEAPTPVPVVPADTTRTDDIVAAVEAKYAGIDVLSATFTQTTRHPLYGDDVQHGTLALARPARMRWDFAGGERVFVSDGANLWVYSRADAQVIKYRDVAAGSGSALGSLLESMDQLDEMFHVDLVDATDKRTVLDLTPPDQDQVKRVRLTLGPDLVVQRLVLTDPLDNVTELEFSEVRTNPELPEGTFAFEPPEGAEVIEAGG